MTNIDAAVNSANIGSQLSNTDDLEVFAECAAAGVALAEIENADDFSWEDQATDWESLCCAISDKIDNRDVPEDWKAWIKEQLTPEQEAVEFKPDHATSLKLAGTFRDAADALYDHLEEEAVERPGGVAHHIRVKLDQFGPTYNEFVMEQEKQIKAEADAQRGLDAARSILEAGKPADEEKCECPKCTLLAKLEAAGIPTERAQEMIERIDGEIASQMDRIKSLLGLGKAPKPLTFEEFKKSLGIDEQAPAAGTPAPEAATPAPTPEEAKVKTTGKNGPVIKLRGSLAQAWLNDPKNKHIVAAYLASQD